MSDINKMATIESIKFYPKKSICFENEKDAEVYIAQDIDTSGKCKQYAGITYEILSELAKKDNHIYELVKTDRPRFSYFDLDGPWIKVKSEVERLMKLNPSLSQDQVVASHVQQWVEDFKAENDPLLGPEMKDLVFIHSSTPKKVSMHIVDPSIYFGDYESCRRYHLKFIEHIEKDNLMTIMVDKNVYDRDRFIRLVNQSKRLPGSQVLQIDNGIPVEDTFITYMTEKKVSIATQPKVPIGWGRQKLKPVEVVEQVDKIPDIYENEELAMVISKLSTKRWQDRDSWLNMVWCLTAIGVSNEQIHELSESNSPENYTDDGCTGAIMCYSPERSPFTMSTLHAWAYQDSGFESQRHFLKKSIPLPAKKDRKKYIDLTSTLHNKKLNMDITQFVYTHGDAVNQSVSYIQTANPFFLVCVNDNETYSVSNKLPKCIPKFILNFPVPDGCKPEYNKLSLDKLMEDEPLHFPLYNKMVFKPNDVNLQKYEKNTWGGFQAEFVDEVDMDKLKPILRHIKEVWADNDEHNAKYILSWIAQIIREPTVPTDKVIVLFGEQGCGKTLICSFLINFLFGRELSMSTTGLDPFTGRFNAAIQGKLFANSNELQCIGENNFAGSFDKMKSLVTERLIQIERKGMEPQQIDNFINFLFTTNNAHTLKIEHGDRRYACFTASNCHNGDNDYFTELVDSFNQDTANHFYTYLFNLEKEERVPLNIIPDTELRRSMIDSSKTPVVKFLETFDDSIFNDLTPEEVYDLSVEDKKLSLTNFYSMYVQWASNSGEKILSSRVVIKMVPSTRIKTKGQGRFTITEKIGFPLKEVTSTKVLRFFQFF